MSTTKEITTESVERVAEAANTQLVQPAKAALEGALQQGETFARQQGEELERWIKREPLAAVGAAFGLGILVTIFVRLKG